MKNSFLILIMMSLFFLAACSNEKSYMLEGNISGLIDPALYIQTICGDSIKIDTILSKNGTFKYISSSDSVKPVVIYMESGSAWTTVWAKSGDTVHISGDVACPELIEANGNEINNLLAEFKQNNREIIWERNDSAGIAEKSEWDQILILNTQAFIQAHPASIASLVLIQDYIVESEDVETIGKSLSLIQSPAKEDKLYARLNAVYHQLQQ
jgi:hypothetical protein